MEQIITFEHLTIEPYKVEKILDIQIQHKINEHSTLYIRALLSDDVKDNYIKECTQGSKVGLKLRNSGKNDVLFYGMVKDIELEVVQGSYYMILYAVSYSYLLDVEKKNRSFQNKQKTYVSLENEIMETYSKAMISDVASRKKELGKFIVQYQETDWEFLKRLASHFHTGLVNDVHIDKVKCYFGIPNNATHTINSFNYSIKKDLGKYLMLSQNGIDGIIEQDVAYYEVESEVPVNIGDTIAFHGKELYVYQINARMCKGILQFNLILSTPKGMSQLFQMHNNIVGVSLDAKICEIKNDRVKVSLQIDEESGHVQEKKCYFPYSTIYSSKDGSGWYCMPEKGDSVRIYFPDGIEEHSYAISSVHDEVDDNLSGSADNFSEAGSPGGGNNGGYSGKRDDPSVKSLRNPSGKEIRLTPDGIYIISNGTTITLTDEDGVSVVSDQNIEFKSDKNIIIGAEQDVSIVGLSGVDLNCKDIAAVKINDNVEVIGQEVKAN